MLDRYRLDLITSYWPRAFYKLTCLLRERVTLTTLLSTSYTEKALCFEANNFDLTLIEFDFEILKYVTVQSYRFVKVVH